MSTGEEDSIEFPALLEQSVEVSLYEPFGACTRNLTRFDQRRPDRALLLPYLQVRRQLLQFQYVRLRTNGFTRSQDSNLARDLGPGATSDVADRNARQRFCGGTDDAQKSAVWEMRGKIMLLQTPQRASRSRVTCQQH